MLAVCRDLHSYEFGAGAVLLARLNFMNHDGQLELDYYVLFCAAMQPMLILCVGHLDTYVVVCMCLCMLICWTPGPGRLDTCVGVRVAGTMLLD